MKTADEVRDILRAEHSGCDPTSCALARIWTEDVLEVIQALDANPRESYESGLKTGHETALAKVVEVLGKERDKHDRDESYAERMEHDLINDLMRRVVLEVTPK